MDIAVVRAIDELRRLSVPALKKKYREVLGQETKTLHKQFLFRRIAWQLQAQAEGDLSPRARQRALEIADDADLRTGGVKGFWSWPDKAAKTARTSSATQRDARLPEPGTLLSRRHQGRDIRVKVLDHGFEYQARHYRSLSAIAREVTGTRWNGLLFFGIAERRRG
jgi:Protein of unknown function (DUF2924)